MKNWEIRFDKKFARKNAQTGEYEDGWFLKDGVVSKDIKDFIRELLKEPCCMNGCGNINCKHCHV